MTHEVIAFETDGVDGDERLIRAYVMDAIERLPAAGVCEEVGFLRYGHDPTIDGGEVRLHVRGDLDAVVDQERDRWGELIVAGLAEGWERLEEDDSDGWGPRGETLSRRLTYLSSRMSREVLVEFDPGELPAPVDTYPEEGPLPIGWWTLLHFLADQRALSAEGEIDASMECVRNRLWALAAREGEAAANERIDDLVDDLESVREEAARIADGD